MTQKITRFLILVVIINRCIIELDLEKSVMMMRNYQGIILIGTSIYESLSLIKYVREKMQFLRKKTWVSEVGKV